MPCYNIRVNVTFWLALVAEALEKLELLAKHGRYKDPILEDARGRLGSKR